MSLAFLRIIRLRAHCQAQVAGVVWAGAQARGAGGGRRAIPVHHARQLQGPHHDQQEVRCSTHLPLPVPMCFNLLIKRAYHSWRIECLSLTLFPGHRTTSLCSAGSSNQPASTQGSCSKVWRTRAQMEHAPPGRAPCASLLASMRSAVAQNPKHTCPFPL